MYESTNIPNNPEIEKALKEFEAKSQTEQMQKSLETSKNSDVSKVVSLVMKWSGGAIKEQKQAEYILLGFVIVAIGVSGFLMFSGGHTIQKASNPVEPIKITPVK